MSRYYIYDSYKDELAEFGTSYSANSRRSSQYRGKEGGRRPRPEGKGVGAAEVRVTGSGQNAMGRMRRSMSKGGALTAFDPGLASDNANSQAFKKMLTKRPSGKLLAAGALGVGALGAGGYGAYRLATRGKRRAAAASAEKERKSIKGRVKRLLGR